MERELSWGSAKARKLFDKHTAISPTDETKNKAGKWMFGVQKPRERGISSNSDKHSLSLEKTAYKKIRHPMKSQENQAVSQQ